MYRGKNIDYSADKYMNDPFIVFFFPEIANEIIWGIHIEPMTRSTQNSLTIILFQKGQKAKAISIQIMYFLQIRLH